MLAETGFGIVPFFLFTVLLPLSGMARRFRRRTTPRTQLAVDVAFLAALISYYMVQAAPLYLFLFPLIYVMSLGGERDVRYRRLGTIAASSVPPSLQAVAAGQ